MIVHVCNDRGAWGKGFVLALSQRWSAPEAAYRRWHQDPGESPFELGAVQFVEVEPALWVANLIGQHGIRSLQGVPPVRYDAIHAGLERVAAFAREHAASVHLPRIGCGLAGGTWDRVEPLLEATLAARGVGVTVYDFAPR
ncbi:MAG: macro domain-containing protein [Planctomycetota bacterium]